MCTTLSNKWELKMRVNSTYFAIPQRLPSSALNDAGENDWIHKTLYQQLFCIVPKTKGIGKSISPSAPKTNQLKRNNWP